MGVSMNPLAVVAGAMLVQQMLITFASNAMLNITLKAKISC